MKSPPPPSPSPSPSLRQWLAGAVVAAVVLGLLKHTSTPRYSVCSPAGNIYTVDPSTPTVECFTVHGDTITNVGTYQQIRSHHWSAPFAPTWLASALAPRIVLLNENEIVVPGLADAHAHIIENGWMMQLPLADASSVQDVIDLIKSYIQAHPDVEHDRTRWIEGMGWDQTRWPGKKFPTADDFDQDPLLKGRPISLSRVDGHARWVSHEVLRQMGKLPTEVEGGLIVRDANGVPTGIFVDNAMRLIPAPEWTQEQMGDFFDKTMEEALKRGLTSIHDADAKVDHIEVFKRKAEEGKLPNRIYAMGNVDSDEYWGHKIPRLSGYGKHGRLNVRAIKLYTDGALGSWGAALLEPYSDKNDTKGIMRIQPEVLDGLVKQFYEDGWQVNIHCIGDQANRVVLDIYEGIILSGANVTQWRPRIEHAQIIEMGDLERIGRLGMIASVQPTHATSDMWYAESRLGPERIKGAYAYQTLLKVSPNHILPLGSDFPVEGVNPLLGFYASVARLTPDGRSPHGNGGWYPNEKLTREQALKGMTLDAAYASFMENELGSLEVGKKADFVILDRDIMTIPIEEILGTVVKATVVDGVAAFGELKP